MDLASSFLPVKKVKSETDFSACLICQKPGKLVAKPTAKSYETLLCFIRDRAGFGESDLIPVDFRLTNETVKTLCLKGASRHRDCYCQTCQKQKQDRARDGYEISQALPIPAKLTRSSLEPCNAQLCFFCQTDKSQTLHEVASPRARIRLREAVEQSNDDKLKLMLSVAMS